MQPNSLVVVLPGSRNKVNPLLKRFIKWFPKDDGETPYTIATIEPSSPDKTKMCITLEEGTIGVVRPGDIKVFPSIYGEICLKPEWLAEIQLPITSEEIIELTEVEEGVYG